MTLKLYFNNSPLAKRNEQETNSNLGHNLNIFHGTTHPNYISFSFPKVSHHAI